MLWVYGAFLMLISGRFWVDLGVHLAVLDESMENLLACPRLYPDHQFNGSRSRRLPGLDHSLTTTSKKISVRACACALWPTPFPLHCPWRVLRRAHIQALLFLIFHPHSHRQQQRHNAAHDNSTHESSLPLDIPCKSLSTRPSPAVAATETAPD